MSIYMDNENMEVAARDRILINKEQATQFLSFSMSTLEKLIKQKKIPVIRLGKRMLFNLEELREWAKDLSNETISLTFKEDDHG